MSVSRPYKPCVLVVDDEEGIRSFVDLVLQERGFEVLLAAGGREALKVFRCWGGQVDAILLDVDMMDMDGPQTLAALRRLAPGLPCCFMTGGDAGNVSRAGFADIRVLAKPFRIDDLVEALWVTIHGPRVGGVRTR